MSKHTKGPWFMDKYENVVDASGRSILFRGMATLCSGSDDRLAEVKENTLLASCAPELLEALEYCEDLLMRYELNRIDGEELSDSALIKIRAAIARAKGETE